MREHFSLLLLIRALSCSVAAMSEDYDTAARLKRQIEGIKAQLASCTDRRVCCVAANPFACALAVFPNYIAGFCNGRAGVG